LGYGLNLWAVIAEFCWAEGTKDGWQIQGTRVKIINGMGQEEIKRKNNMVM